VVYGRRRIAACRALGLKVKAYVKEMDQREALVSQALENSARLERSFIEQAIFATKLEDQGFTRAEIGDVMAVDKGTLSKLIGVARDVPADVIYQIGAAHDAGRRPWLELRRLVKLDAAPTGAALLALVPGEGSAAERLNHLVGRLQKIETRKLAPPPARLTESGPVAAKARGQRLLIQVADKDSRGFLTYLEGRIAELYDTWKRS
jgi:ParB family chromosome partitioning protein